MLPGINALTRLIEHLNGGANGFTRNQNIPTTTPAPVSTTAPLLPTTPAPAAAATTVKNLQRG